MAKPIRLTADPATTRPGGAAGRLPRRGRSGRPQAHDYVALLGLRVYDPLRIDAAIRQGLPYSALLHLQRATGLAVAALAAVAEVPQRTLARRKVQRRFSAEESDRIARFARVFGRALELFDGNVDAARDWLTADQMALGDQSPLALVATDIGAAEVDRLIGRLEYGIPT